MSGRTRHGTRYENLKGKYFEIKRAQMNGEQRPYWLYYNEMDYIISHFPGHRPRISVGDANSSAATSSTPNASTNAALASDTSAQSASDFPEVKPSRATLDNSEYTRPQTFAHLNMSEFYFAILSTSKS